MSSPEELLQCLDAITSADIAQLIVILGDDKAAAAEACETLLCILLTDLNAATKSFAEKCIIREAIDGLTKIEPYLYALKQDRRETE